MSGTEVAAAKILVPLDQFEGGETKIPVAIQYARLMCAQIVLLQVLCPNCGRLVPDEHLCPACGVEGEPLVSLKEAIVEQALAQGATVETVAGTAASRLEDHGGIGAWTRF
jgi:hypothetical protein